MMHYYQFNIGDYASHTRHLTPMEDLVYRRLLDLYYLQERPLSDCSTAVARLINLRGYEQDVETVLNEFFEHVEGVGFINRRADLEIEKYHRKLDASSRAGKASAKTRANKDLGVANGCATVVQRTLNVGCSTDVQPTKNQEPRTKNQEPERKRGTRLDPATAFTDEWADFCKANRPDLDPDKVFAKFSDYWTAKPGRQGTKLDWLATWRNWVREERGERGGGQQTTKPRRPHTREDFATIDYGSGIQDI